MSSGERHAAAAEAERIADGEVNQAETEFESSAIDLSAATPEVSSDENSALETSSGYPPIQGQPVTSQQSSSGRLWATAGTFAVIVALLTIAGIYLITKKSSTVDQLVILTVPSGAEITLGSKGYGHSPVKLEKVPIGNYMLTMTKEGYETRVEQITVAESQPFEYREFRLKPLPPADAAGAAPEEQVKQNLQWANDAFAVGRYAIPYDQSALYFANAILQIDGNNPAAEEMRERIRKTLHQNAQGAASRGDLARAQEIYQFLGEYFPDDEDARAAATRLENQLSSRRGEVRELLAQAQDALDAGRFADPEQASAYYYSKQALARDRQNAQARAIRDTVRKRLSDQSELAYRREDIDTAIKQLERATQLFPEDTEMRSRLHEWMNQKAEEVKAATDPVVRRRHGLELANREDCTAAIPDLEFAINNSQGTGDVLFALARCHQKLGHLEQAAGYYLRVPEMTGEAHRSAIAALGEIAMARNDTAGALAQYKKALQLGGSTRYTPAILQDKIDKIESKQREKAAEPTALTIQVKHLHGKLRGSCSGTLSVTSKGVRYDGKDAFAANLSWTNVVVSKDKFTLQIQGKSMDFTASPGEAELFREALGRYQAAINR